MIERDPFDPTDPMDAMSEMFRRQVTDLAIKAEKVTLYRELNAQQQLQCFLAGALTGVVGVCLASVTTAGADEMMEAIKDCLPDCREMAENVRGPEGNVLANHHDAPVGDKQQP